MLDGVSPFSTPLNRIYTALRRLCGSEGMLCGPLRYSTPPTGQRRL